MATKKILLCWGKVIAVRGGNSSQLLLAAAAADGHGPGRDGWKISLQFSDRQTTEEETCRTEHCGIATETVTSGISCD